jgi:hypothetical protein
MNKRLDEVLTKVRALPEQEQQVIAEILTDYLEADTLLTPEQWAEVDEALAEDDVATDREVEAFFARLGK